MRFAQVRPASPRAKFSTSPFRTPILFRIGARGEGEEASLFRGSGGANLFSLELPRLASAFPHPAAPRPTSHRVMGGRIGHELGGET
jgi:hypothetical protein